MAIAKLDVSIFKNIAHFRECEVGSIEISSLGHFNPLPVPFIPV